MNVSMLSLMMLMTGVGAPAPDDATDDKDGRAIERVDRSPSGQPDRTAEWNRSAATDEGAGAGEQADPRAPESPTASPFEAGEAGETAEAGGSGGSGEPAEPPEPERSEGEQPNLKDPMGDAPPAASSVSARRAARVYPDRPVRYRLGAYVAGGSSTFFDKSFRAFDDDRSEGTLDAGLRADFRLAQSRVFLGFGAGYRFLTTDHSTLGGTLDTEAKVREPLIFVRASIQIVDGIDVFVEPGGGPTVVDVRVRSDDWAKQRTVAGMFNGIAGLAVYLPKKWLPRRGSSRITGGLEGGIGYTWRSKIEVSPKPKTDDDPITTQGTDLGDLSLSGLTWRIGGFIRFM